MATTGSINSRIPKNWEDAFERPIPQVRALHRQLQNDLTLNREKLRGLVGYWLHHRIKLEAKRYL